MTYKYAKFEDDIEIGGSSKDWQGLGQLAITIVKSKEDKLIEFCNNRTSENKSFEVVDITNPNDETIILYYTKGGKHEN